MSYLFFEEKNILKTILRKYTLEKSQRNADTNLRKLKNADEKAYQMVMFHRYVWLPEGKPIGRDFSYVRGW